MRRRTLATLPVTSLQLVMVNVLELDVLFDVELLDFGGAQSISRTSHCTFDLGNLRILNCTYSRVLSFPSVILKFLRGIFRQSSECSARTLLVVLMTSSSFSPLLPDCVAESSFCSAFCITCSITTLVNTVVRFELVRLDVSLWILACSWHCSPSACCWHCSSFMGSGVPSLAVCLSPSRPSIPCSFVHISPVAGCDRVAVSCSQRVLQTFSLASCPHWLRLLVTFPCSWHALQTSSSSPLGPILGFGSCASPRSLASSGLTATFWSSSSPSRHFCASSCGTSRLFCSSNSILW